MDSSSSTRVTSATLANIRQLLSEQSKPIVSQDKLERFGGAFSPKEFWDRVCSFYVKSSSPNWMMGKSDVRLSPINLARHGWRLLEPAKQSSESGDRIVEVSALCCDICKRRKLWDPPRLPSDRKEPLVEMELLRGYSSEFSNTISSSHSDLCLFRRANCASEIFSVPPSHNIIQHTSDIISRLESLNSLRSDILPKISAASSLFASANPASATLKQFISDPDTAWKQLAVSHSEFGRLQSMSSNSRRESRLLLLALCGWSAPASAHSPSSNRANSTSLTPPRELDLSKNMPNADCLIGCRLCRRVINLSFFEQDTSSADSIDVDDSADTTDESGRRKLRKLDENNSSVPSFTLSRSAAQEFDPVSQHRWHCPWAIAPAANSLSAEPEQDRAGYLLAVQSLFSPPSTSENANEKGSSDSASSTGGGVETAAATLLQSPRFAALLR